MGILGFWDEAYPKSLSNDRFHPPILFYKGDIAFLNESDSVSIVGTRRNSPYGKNVTEKFTKEFVNSGITIISGMAQGIDSIAHKCAMSEGGKTVAVLASGLDQIMPRYSNDFSKKIVDSGGALLSAYPPLKKALNQFFVQRNRIIAGLSKATIVIESKEKGGSLWTAKFASEQNKDIYAVPGNIFSEKSLGTHKLIESQVAQIALSPEQIMKELEIGNITKEVTSNNEIQNLDTIDRLALDIIEADPQNIQVIFDKINEEVSISIGDLQALLLKLEFMGLIKQSSGNTYIKN